MASNGHGEGYPSSSAFPMWHRGPFCFLHPVASAVTAAGWLHFTSLASWVTPLTCNLDTLRISTSQVTSCYLWSWGP